MDLTTTPGMQPPAGLTSNFYAPYNALQIGTMIAFGVTYFLATVALALRYFQAFKLIQKIEIDLVIITLSYGDALAYFVTMISLMKQGWGKHMWDVNLVQLVELNKSLLPNTLTYLICPSITKMAILSVLYRINPSLIYRSSVAAVACLIFAYTLTLCIITGGPCSPLKEGTLHCLENVAVSGAVLNIVSDLAVLALPIPTIYNLHLPLKQKFTVGFLLALGSGVVLCSIARLPYVLRLTKNPDATWTQAILGVWSIVEINLGIICACAMRFRRLIMTYLPKLSLFSSRLRSRNTKEMHNESTGVKSQPKSNQWPNSYQLNSIQKASAGSTTANDNVTIYQTFEVNVERTEQDGEDGRSTDRILT